MAFIDATRSRTKKSTATPYTTEELMNLPTAVQKGIYDASQGTMGSELQSSALARLGGAKLTPSGSGYGVLPQYASEGLTELSMRINAGQNLTDADAKALASKRNTLNPTTFSALQQRIASELGGASQTGAGGGSQTNLGGGSDGSKFGSVGGGYNVGGTTYQYDSAGNRILGQLGGRNVITGGGGVDRSAGVSRDPMSAWSQFTDPNYFMGRSEDIRKQVERQMQGTIDAINRQYEGQVRREEEAGAQDLARMRSMNLRAGLGGSTFGAANKAEVRDRTSANIRDIQANQDVAVGNAIMKIEEIANQRISMEQTAMQNAFTNSMAMAEYVQAQQDRARTQTLESVANIAKMDPNMSVKDIAERDPNLYQAIRQNTGMGDFEIDAYLNSANGVTSEHVWKGNTMLTLRKDAQGNVLSTKTYSAEELGVPQGINMQTITNQVTGETFYWDADNVEKDANGNVIMRSLGKTMPTIWDQAALDRANAEFEANLKSETDGAEVDKLTKYQLDSADRTMLVAQDALGKINGWTAGYGAALANLPATEARKLEGYITTLKANIGFKALQDMRAASPTGGALGQVAVQELNYLQSIEGSLDRYQDPETLRANIQGIQTSLSNWKRAVIEDKNLRTAYGIGPNENYEIAPDGSIVIITDKK